jgi:hypothetical protein
MDKKKLRMVFGVILPSLLILACSFTGTATPTLSTNTRILPPSWTTAPSKTLPPSPTPIFPETVIQAQKFGGSILNAIANRPPDFQDDFSANTGWAWQMAGQVSIVNGVMQVNGVGGSGIWHDNLQSRSGDYVLQFEVRLNTPGQMGTFFRLRGSDYFDAVEIDSAKGSWRIDLACCSDQENDGHYGNTGVLPIGEINQITLILKGQDGALYLNGEPTAYFVDTTNTGNYEYGSIQLSFWGENEGAFDPQKATPVSGEFDNVKFWDITNLP